jgi:hypothetical protein
LLLCAISFAQSPETYDATWYTVDGGGDMWTVGGTYELSGTIGQPDAGMMTGGVYELTGGFWVSAVVVSVCVGDMNCDGHINFGDINPFVQYLTGYASWLATYPGCSPLNGDINCDGVYGQAKFGDINSFVTLIVQCASGCQCPGPFACP